jgi:hypothetical protein
VRPRVGLAKNFPDSTMAMEATVTSVVIFGVTLSVVLVLVEAARTGKPGLSTARQYAAVPQRVSVLRLRRTQRLMRRGS